MSKKLNSNNLLISIVGLCLFFIGLSISLSQRIHTYKYGYLNFGEYHFYIGSSLMVFGVVLLYMFLFKRNN